MRPSGETLRPRVDRPTVSRSAMSSPEIPTNCEASDQGRLRLGRNPKVQFAAVCAAILGFAYALNATTPMVADDFTFAYTFRTTTRIANLADILNSQWIFYMTRNGRLVGGVFAQLAVLLGKPTFNVLNSVAFLMLVLLMYINTNGLRRIRISLLIGIPVLLWFTLPSFGQSMLFIAAAVNYLWLAVLVMAAILPFRIHAEWPSAIPDTLLTVLVMAAATASRISMCDPTNGPTPTWPARCFGLGSIRAAVAIDSPVVP